MGRLMSTSAPAETGQFTRQMLYPRSFAASAKSFFFTSDLLVYHGTG